MIDEEVMLQITAGRFARRTPMASLVTATAPSTFVSKRARQSSSSACSTGR